MRAGTVGKGNFLQGQLGTAKQCFGNVVPLLVQVFIWRVAVSNALI